MDASQACQVPPPHCPPSSPGLSSVTTRAHTAPCLCVCGACRTLVDDKIGAKELPKDLQRLATKVLESEQDVQKTLGKKIEKKVTQRLQATFHLLARPGLASSKQVRMCL